MAVVAPTPLSVAADRLFSAVMPRITDENREQAGLLIDRLPELLRAGDRGALVDWLVQFVPHSQTLGASFETSQALTSFTEAGFAPLMGSRTPTNLEEAHTRLIGVALDCLVQTGYIHEVFVPNVDKAREMFRVDKPREIFRVDTARPTFRR